MAVNKLPPIEYLRQLLDYDPETGHLTWKERPFSTKQWNAKFVGKRAGSIHCKGYIAVGIDGKVYLAHRIIWAIFYGNEPEYQIDHKDMNPANNKIDNLREATASQNRWNERARRNNKLGIKGVHYCKKDKKYIAELKVNYKRVAHSYHATLDEAQKAYEKAAQLYHGEFARTK